MKTALDHRGHEVTARDLMPADFDPEPHDPQTDTLRAHTRSLAAAATDDTHPRHDEAVAEVEAVRAAGAGRLVEAAVLWRAGVL